MAWLIDPIIIILLVVITQSGHIPIALKVILCIVLACVRTIMGICMFRGGGEYQLLTKTGGENYGYKCK